MFESFVPTYGVDFVVLTGLAEPIQIWEFQVSPGFFSLLGVRPLLGRTFQPKEGRPGAAPVVIISHRLWQRQLGGDPGVIGSILTLDGQGYTVVGVLPRDFQYLHIDWVDAWAPQRNPSPTRTEALARLRPGLTALQAEDILAPLAERDRPTKEKEWAPGSSLHVISLTESMTGSEVKPLLLLLGASGFVLLIACANVASLFLAAIEARQKELAVRSSLGASRSQLLALLLGEVFWVFLLGGAVGLLLSSWVSRLVLALYPISFPGIASGGGGVSWGVAAYGLLASLAAAAVAIVWPAWSATRMDLKPMLKGSGSLSFTDPGRARWGRTLVVIEVALAMVLLVGAGLMVRVLLFMYPSDPGFETENRLAMMIELAPYKYATPDRQRAYFEQLLDELKGIPGVEDAAVVHRAPLWTWGIRAEAKAAEDQAGGGGRSTRLLFQICTPNFLDLMGIPILQGRRLSADDRAGAPRVAVITETLVRRLWPDEDPLGKRIRVQQPAWMGEQTVVAPGGGIGEYTVVGVAKDVRAHGITLEIYSEMYVPLAQSAYSKLTVVVKTGVRPESMVRHVRAAVWRVDPGQPIRDMKTMDEILSESVLRLRRRMHVLGLPAGLAALLAVVGIYGVLSFRVGRRMRELGIRAALGAQPGHLIRLVVREGMALVLTGVGLGLVGAFWLTRFLASQLEGISPADPLTLLGVSGLFLAIGLLACLAPGRRVTNIPLADLLKDI